MTAAICTAHPNGPEGHEADGAGDTAARDPPAYGVYHAHVLSSREALVANL